MSYFNLDTVLRFVLPRLLTMTLVSFVIGSAVGAVVGWLATLIWWRTQRDKDPLPPRQWLFKPAIVGSFIGMLLIGLLPIAANPASLIGGPYGGLWLFIMFLLLAPLGSISGAVLGVILGIKLPSRIKQPKLMGIVLVITYLFCASTLYVGLAPPRVVMSTPLSSDSFPVVAELTGYDSSFKDLALSHNGQQLAVLTVRYDEDTIEIWDLPSRRVVHTLQSEPNVSRTLKTIVVSLGFSLDGQELITAAPQQVQVRDLANGKVRLRLDGGTLAYPMADNKLVTLAVVDAWASDLQDPEPYNLKVWDSTTGKLLHTISADLAPAERDNLPIAVSPDHRLLAFPPALYGNQIQVWDVSNHKLVSSLVSQNPAGILSLAFSPDGQQLAIALGQGSPLAIWDWQSATQLKTIADAGRADYLYWTQQGIFVGSDGGFNVYDPQTGKVLQTLDLQPSASPSQTTIQLPLGPSALSADRTTLTAYIPQQGIRVWQVDK